MTGNTKLVIGASGFLGSRVARQLVGDGQRVRVLIRPTSSTRGIDDLDVEVRRGDIFDEKSVRAAMTGCDDVYYCVVDTRAWLRDPAPLFRTNVEGLRKVLDVAADAGLRRFVFTSSFGTIGRVEHGLADEQTQHNWLDIGGGYIRSRVEAENLVLGYHREKGLPAVAMCVANTYGPGDWQPTPHGAVVAAVARGKLPFYVSGAASEVVGIDDAARAMILAADRGNNGERYIVSERFMSARDIHHAVCTAVGITAPKIGVPLSVMSMLCGAATSVAALLGKDTRLSPQSLRLTNIMSPMSHDKAVRELGWDPKPTTEALAEAARFFRTNRRSSAQ